MKINVEIDSKGYLRLRTNIKNENGNMQAKTKSLNIKIERQSDFLKATQKVSSKHAKYKEYNQQILEAKQAFETELTNIQVAKNIIDSKEEILILYKEYLDTKTNFASVAPLASVRNTFVKFLTTKNITILACSNFNQQLILEFRTYLQTTKNKNKFRSTFTVQKNLSNLKVFINWIIKNQKYEWSKHPFEQISTTAKTRQKDRMQESDFKKIMVLENIRKRYIDDKILFLDSVTNFRLKTINNQFEKLLKYRDVFCFSVFGNGIRITDLVCLKFSNFRILDGDKFSLKYITNKTGTEMNVHISHKILKFLETHIISVMQYLKPEMKDVLLLNYLEAKEEFKNASDADKFEARNKINSCLYNLLKIVSTHNKTENKQLFFNSDDRYNEAFEKLEVRKLTKKQRSIVTEITSINNTALKEIAMELHIHCNLSSHIARHQFASFMLESGANIYEIKTSMSHLYLTSTETYIKSLTGNEKLTARISAQMEDQFFKEE